MYSLPVVFVNKNNNGKRIFLVNKQARFLYILIKLMSQSGYAMCLTAAVFLCFVIFFNVFAAYDGGLYDYP